MVAAVVVLARVFGGGGYLFGGSREGIFLCGGIWKKLVSVEDPIDFGILEEFCQSGCVECRFLGCYDRLFLVIDVFDPGVGGGRGFATGSGDKSRAIGFAVGGCAKEEISYGFA